MKFKQIQENKTILKKAIVGTLTVFTLLSGPKVLADGPSGLDTNKCIPKTEAVASKNEKPGIGPAILFLSVFVSAFGYGVWKIEQHINKEMQDAEDEHNRNKR